MVTPGGFLAFFPAGRLAKAAEASGTGGAGKGRGLCEEAGGLCHTDSFLSATSPPGGSRNAWSGDRGAQEAPRQSSSPRLEREATRVTRVLPFAPHANLICPHGVELLCFMLKSKDKKQRQRSGEVVHGDGRLTGSGDGAVCHAPCAELRDVARAQLSRAVPFFGVYTGTSTHRIVLGLRRQSTTV